MKIAKITQYRNRAIKEAQKEVDKVFKKYSKLINEEIASQIPKGQKLLSYNGLNVLFDLEGKEINGGNSWSRTAEYNPKYDFLASLQYQCEDVTANIDLDTEIIGTKI